MAKHQKPTIEHTYSWQQPNEVEAYSFPGGERKCIDLDQSIRDRLAENDRKFRAAGLWGGHCTLDREADQYYADKVEIFVAGVDKYDVPGEESEGEE